MAGLFLPSSLVFLLLAVNLPTMLKYLACSLCAIRIAGSEPDLAATARVALSLRAVTVCAWIAVICAIGVILAGLEADMRPYYLVLGWFAVGTVYYLVRSRRSGAL
jgi:APA family basic amino acid/polyamine antiporter